MKVDVTNPSPDASNISLAALSRNASVISTSSSESGSNGNFDLLATPPPRLNRTFNSPGSRSPSRIAPAYIPKELPIADGSPAKARAASKPRSKSRGKQLLTIEDFVFGETIGEGSYSTVVSATVKKKDQQLQYAVKILEKAHLIRKNKIHVAMIEKAAFTRLGMGHPGVIRMYFAFQDQHSLYFVLDLATNGEMQALISRLGSLDTECSKYYTAQIVDGLAFIHGKGVIHRDVKPENLLLDSEWRIKITDFGTAKIVDHSGEAERFVGTAQYVAPELLEANETSRSSDWWALGCILYQMISGRFAFSGLSEYLTLQKVKKMEYSFPDAFDEQAKDLVEELLVREPTQRLGAGETGDANDVSALRAHPFLSTIDWENLWTIPAPPLRAGLVKNEHPLAQGTDKSWEDVGSLWDSMPPSSSGDENDTDGIEWASSHGSSDQHVFVRTDPFQGQKSLSVDIAIGPSGETRVMEATLPNGTSVVSRQVSMKSEGNEIPGAAETSGGVEGITQDMHALKRPTSRLPHEQLLLEENERGRSKAMTPVQGNGPSLNLHSLLGLPSDEHVIHHSSLETRSLRRRASMLLTIANAQMKPKIRDLVLTNRRVICVKIRGKTPGDFTVKAEFWFRSDKDKPHKNNGKEKDTRMYISSVEVKGEREFVVITPAKNYHYAAHTPQEAARWVEELNTILGNSSESE